MASEVQNLYQSLLAKGRTPKDAAREAQQRTGFSVVTDNPIKPKELKFTKEGVTYGQSPQLKRPGSSQKQRVQSQFRL